MTSSDSMFLFDIIVEEIKSYFDCKYVIVKAQFPDIFEINLNNPCTPKILKRKKTKRKTKVRDVKTEIAAQKTQSESRPQRDESVLVTINTQELVKVMQNNELELSLWRKDKPIQKIGSTKIPWSTEYTSYLMNLETMLEPVSIREFYNIYDEVYYEKIATVKLNVKLTHFGYKTEPISNNETTLVQHYRNACKCTKSNLGIIKTTYYGGKKLHKKTKRIKSEKEKRSSSSDKPSLEIQQDSKNIPLDNIKSGEKEKKTTKVDNVAQNPLPSLAKSKSFSTIEKKHIKAVNYIFGDPNVIFGNKVYCVNYCTVEKDKSNPESAKSSVKEPTSEKSSHSRPRLKFKPCDSDCQIMKTRTGSCPASMCSIDMNEEAAPLITITKCKQLTCEEKEHRKLPPPLDDRILLDLANLERECCDRTEVTETLEEVIGGVKTQMKIGQDPCYCTCECTFGFYKKTTYCKICGGYERVGEEKPEEKKANFPCPIYHKLVDKNKMKSWSTSGSDSKKRGDDTSVKGMKVGSNQRAASTERKPVVEKKSVESEKDKKCKKKKKDDRFKFNYGYKAPQIGHSRCALPCTGTLGSVPKHMGWLWTAEDIPGMKFRPSWRPGATNKHVVRLLRMARNPGEVTPKKRRKDAGKKKRPLNRPLLIVHKKDGEFTVTMETMKTYAKPRAINQCPYEDKPALTYTIGRTEEENRERQKKKERVQRRLERDQRAFIQSAFRDMCHEICLKTYQQALGILPDTEDPPCTCYPAEPTADRTNMDVSCSCSEDSRSLASDTDEDEWIVEFTPPCATFNQHFKGKKVIKVDNSSQYTYLDYRVKLLDRFGNPVQRFFRGPDGKQQCSDLGGFWGPDKKWVEINVDGYVAPDGRWAPNNFIGPNGEQVDATAGKFQTVSNKWLVVGVDGYVDCQGRWRAYPRPRGLPAQKKSPRSKKQGTTGKGAKQEELPAFKSEASWSCFGDASPKELSKLGIVGHGQDKKLLYSTLREMMARGENVKIPQPSTIFRLPPSNRRRRQQSPDSKYSRSLFEERTRCKHSTPSDKGILAVDDQGNKTYFRLKNFRNARPKQRLATLTKRGISLSSFHVPCFHSFINSEVMKKQQRDRLMALAAINTATQVG